MSLGRSVRWARRNVKAISRPGDTLAIHTRQLPSQHRRPLESFNHTRRAVPTSDELQRDLSEPSVTIRESAARLPSRPLRIQSRTRVVVRSIQDEIDSEKSLFFQEAKGSNKRQNKLDIGVANRFYGNIRRLVRFRRFEEALDEVFVSLSSPRFPDRIRGEFYENVLELYLDRRRYDDALKVYESMLSEGLVASPPVRATMLTLKIARATGEMNFEELESGLVRILVDMKTSGQGVFTEAHFRSLLTYLNEAGFHRTMIERLAYVFIETQGPDYRLSPELVTSFIIQYYHSGTVKEAERWLDYHSDTLALRDPDPDTDKDSRPYTAFVNVLAARPRVRVDQYKPVLERMAKDKVWPGLAMINTLIKLEAKNRRYDASFKLYDSVLRLKKERKVDYGLHGSEFTFASLFSAIYRFWHEQSWMRKPYGSVKEINLPAPDWLIPPRKLFREMLETYDHAVGSPRIHGLDLVITQGTLHQAIKVFMFQYDYPAALIALRAFQLLDVELSKYTGVEIATRLICDLHRSLLALTPGNERNDWLNNFLPPKLDPLFIQRATMDEMAKVIIAIGRRKMISQLPEEDRQKLEEKEREGEQTGLFGGTRERKRTRVERLKEVHHLLFSENGQGFKFEFLDAILLRAVEAQFGIPDVGIFAQFKRKNDWKRVKLRHEENTKRMQDSLAAISLEMVPDLPKAVKKLQEIEKQIEKFYGRKVRYKSLRRL